MLCSDHLQLLRSTRYCCHVVSGAVVHVTLFRLDTGPVIILLFLLSSVFEFCSSDCLILLESAKYDSKDQRKTDHFGETIMNFNGFNSITIIWISMPLFLVVDRS
jgi:hypothetical protein